MEPNDSTELLLCNVDFRKVFDPHNPKNYAKMRNYRYENGKKVSEFERTVNIFLWLSENNSKSNSEKIIVQFNATKDYASVTVNIGNLAFVTLYDKGSTGAEFTYYKDTHIIKRLFTFFRHSTIERINSDKGLTEIATVFDTNIHTISRLAVEKYNEYMSTTKFPLFPEDTLKDYAENVAEICRSYKADMSGGGKKRAVKRKAAPKVYTNTGRKYVDKKGVERVLYSRGKRLFVKKKDAKTGLFVYRPVSNVQ